MTDEKARYKGKYVLHCISCYGRNFNDSKEPIVLRKVDEEIWNLYQEAHDVAENHDIVLIHESRLPKYVLKNIHGGNECQKIAL